jgi:hypothetical protein
LKLCSTNQYEDDVACIPGHKRWDILVYIPEAYQQEVQEIDVAILGKIEDVTASAHEINDGGMNLRGEEGSVHSRRQVGQR